MFEEPLSSLRVSVAQTSSTEPSGALAELRALLIGNSLSEEDLPPLADLIAGAIALAEGLRHKVILPLGRSALEFALVRRGADVLVDYYGTESTPEILLRQRRIALGELLEVCAQSARALARESGSTTLGRALWSLSLRATFAETGPVGDIAAVADNFGELRFAPSFSNESTDVS